MNKFLSSRQLIAGAVGTLLLLTVVYILFRADLSATFYFTLLWLSAVSLLLFLGNRLIANILNRNFPWLKYGTFRFVLHLLLGIVYSLIILNLAYFLFKYLLTDELPIWSQVLVTNVYGIAIFIPLFSIYFSLYFLRHWRTSIVAREKAEKANIKAQLLSLKDHLDPHFLFNNLNILSSLIEIDVDRSQEFLAKFAEVYRAILMSKEEDLMPLSEELKFMESYIFLIRTRFREDIRFSFEIDDHFMHHTLPPLSLQMLVENAVKHNKITEKQPLHIEIATTRSSEITVRNNLNVLELEEHHKSGSGLKNLEGRYAPFTNRKVKVSDKDEFFTVHLPLLKTENL
ncbi:MAG: histidine kinase [Bacteroidota bacterium]